MALKLGSMENSVGWCDKEWDAASWCDCIGKREEWYYGRRAEKKLVPCRDGTTPYNTIPYIPYQIIPYHTLLLKQPRNCLLYTSDAADE